MDDITLSIKQRMITDTADVSRQVFGPLSTVKLESGRTMVINTGLQIIDYTTPGTLEIVPFEAYVGKLTFKDNVFDVSYPNELCITVINTSNEFVRLDPEHHRMFVVIWRPSADAPAETPADAPAETPAVKKITKRSGKRRVVKKKRISV